MNTIALQFNLPKLGPYGASLFGSFSICVDDRRFWCCDTFLYSESSMSLPSGEPVAVSIDDRMCVEECCGGLWATARREGDTIVWTDFRSTEPHPDDPPPDTTYIFSVAEYEAQLASAKAAHAEVEYLKSCPPFDELMEKLHERLVAVDCPPFIEWLMEEDFIRAPGKEWIRYWETPEDDRPARIYYERLRDECWHIEIRVARHPGADRMLAMLCRRHRNRSPSLAVNLGPSYSSKPVRSHLAWSWLRARFGINRHRPGFVDYTLPSRLG